MIYIVVIMFSYLVVTVFDCISDSYQFLFSCNKLCFHLVHSLGEGSRVIKELSIAAGRGSGRSPDTKGMPAGSLRGHCFPEAPRCARG